MCLRLLHTLLELKVWLPSSSSVCYCLKFCQEQSEWVLIFFWMVKLITELSLPHLLHCPDCRISPLPLCRAVQGESTVCRMWTQLCVHPFFLHASARSALRPVLPCCYWYSKHMLLSIGLGFQGLYSTLPAPFPQVSLRRSGCMNLTSLEIRSENKLHDLGKKELPGSVTVATLQLHL